MYLQKWRQTAAEFSFVLGRWVSLPTYVGLELITHSLFELLMFSVFQGGQNRKHSARDTLADSCARNLVHEVLPTDCN